MRNPFLPFILGQRRAEMRTPPRDGLLSPMQQTGLLAREPDFARVQPNSVATPPVKGWNPFAVRPGQQGIIARELERANTRNTDQAAMEIGQGPRPGGQGYTNMAATTKTPPPGTRIAPHSRMSTDRTAPNSMDDGWRPPGIMQQMPGDDVLAPSVTIYPEGPYGVFTPNPSGGRGGFDTITPQQNEPLRLFGVDIFPPGGNGIPDDYDARTDPSGKIINPSYTGRYLFNPSKRFW